MRKVKHDKFSHDRDDMLDEFHRKLLLRLTNAQAAHYFYIIDVCDYHFKTIKFFTNDGRHTVSQLQNFVTQNMTNLSNVLTDIIYKSRRLTYLAQSASELERLSRLKNERNKLEHNFNVNKDELLSKVVLSLHQTKSKIIQEIERCYVAKDRDIEKRIKKVLPQIKKVKKPLIREAKKFTTLDKVDELSQSFISENDWDSILSDYKADFIPLYRNDKTESGRFYRDENDVYASDVERLATDEWLQGVKDGTNEAAIAAGVTDLMWVAVLDSHTREEHERRDGLLKSEIEDKLENDSDWKDDEYDSVAPSGFNCRCRSVPYIPEAEGETGDFDSWITN